MIKHALSMASATLLSSPAVAEQETNDNEWQIDVSLLTYIESSRRTEVLAPMILANKQFDSGDQLRLRFAVDVITGASPTGAMPSSRVQTFTRPSGIGNYTISPGEIPVDDTFMDTRVSFAADWDKAISRYNRIILGGHYSYEYDFISVALRATYAHELLNRNTMLTAGLSAESNDLDPEGGVPIELSTAMIPNRMPQNRRAQKEQRQQVDWLLGLTQVLSRKTIMQFNLGYAESDGYHTDPFKVVSIIEASDVDTLGEPLDNIFEHRPDYRKKKTLFWKLNHHFEKQILSIAYRWADDDWGIRSNTLDLRHTFLLQTRAGSSWQAHIRLYQQQAADFYRSNLLSTQGLPEFVSADYRLGKMDSITLGLKYRFLRKSGTPFEIRCDYIMQDNTASDGSKIGYLESTRIVDDTTAVLLQFNYIL